MSRQKSRGLSIRFEIDDVTHPSLVTELGRAQGRKRRDRVLGLLYQGLTLERYKQVDSNTAGRVEPARESPVAATEAIVGSGVLSSLFGIEGTES